MSDQDTMREIAREEIASLCGMVLRRLEDMTAELAVREAKAIFGEALRDFSGTVTEPGEN